MQNARTGGDFCISIHALREEGDNPIRRKQRRPFQISIHALREEGDASNFMEDKDGNKFLSTPSVRRATVDGPVSVQLVEFLSTPSVRRATVPKFSRLFWICYFYPRPPRGGRPKNPFRNNKSTHFCPRPPRGGRRRRRCRPQSWIYFYPRPPRGGRPAVSGSRLPSTSISIHALREEGDALRSHRVSRGQGISIHALREEGDFFKIHVC